MKLIVAALTAGIVLAASLAPAADLLPWEKDELEKGKNFIFLDEHDKQQLLDCLCRCSSTAKEHVPVFYKAEPYHESPSCSKPENGSCVNQGFGCWRHRPVREGECENSCYGKLRVDKETLRDSLFK